MDYTSFKKLIRGEDGDILLRFGEVHAWGILDAEGRLPFFQGRWEVFQRGFAAGPDDSGI